MALSPTSRKLVAFRTRIGVASILVALLSAGLGHAETQVGVAPRAGEIDAIPAGRSVQDRVDEIRRRVQQAVVYPDAARRRGIHGTTRIQFEVNAEGHAKEVTTVASSGSDLLDAAAKQRAVDAAPLPYVFGRLRIPVVFELKGRARE